MKPVGIIANPASGKDIRRGPLVVDLERTLEEAARVGLMTQSQARENA